MKPTPNRRYWNCLPTGMLAKYFRNCFTHKYFRLTKKSYMEPLFHKAINYEMFLNQISYYQHAWIISYCVYLFVLFGDWLCIFACGRLPGLQRVRLRRLSEHQPRQVSHSCPTVFFALCSCFICIVFSDFYFMLASYIPFIAIVL